MSTAGRSPWPRVGLLYLCGLMAAAQLGKLSALAPLMAGALGLGLTTMAAAISMLELGGATLGAIAGRVAERLGLRRTLLVGVAALAVAGWGSATAQGATGLVSWRLLEAAGYLGVIVSAPVLIALHAGAAGPRVQALALTLWSSFVPVGLALGAWGAASLAAWDGWRTALAASGLLGSGLWLLLWWSTRSPRAAQPDGASASGDGGSAAHPSAAGPSASVRDADAPGAAPAGFGGLPPAGWSLALGFGAFALFEIGALALLPTLLVQQAGLDAGAAGRWTAVASASALLGIAVAAWRLRHGGSLRTLVGVSLGLPPLLLFGVFHEAPDTAVAVSLAVAVNAVGGIFASLAFALLPRVAPDAVALVRTNGAIAQCGASGSLLGPPLMAAAVDAGGWAAAAWLGLVVSAVALALTGRAMARAGLR